jgi:hypothetical protein
MLGIIHTMKKQTIIGISLVLLIVGSVLAQQDITRPSDANIRKNLTGAWHVVPFLPGGDSGSKIIYTISPNGDFTRQGIFTNGLHSFDMSGTLQVQDGYLIETVTNSSQKRVHIPRVSREKIIRADDREVVFTIEGMTNQITIQKDMTDTP